MPDEFEKSRKTIDNNTGQQAPSINDNRQQFSSLSFSSNSSSTSLSSSTSSSSSSLLSTPLSVIKDDCSSTKSVPVKQQQSIQSSSIDSQMYLLVSNDNDKKTNEQQLIQEQAIASTLSLSSTNTKTAPTKSNKGSITNENSITMKQSANRIVMDNDNRKIKSNNLESMEEERLANLLSTTTISSTVSNNNSNDNNNDNNQVNGHYHQNNDGNKNGLIPVTESNNLNDYNNEQIQLAKLSMETLKESGQNAENKSKDNLLNGEKIFNNNLINNNEPNIDESALTNNNNNNNNNNNLKLLTFVTRPTTNPSSINTNSSSKLSSSTSSSSTSSLLLSTSLLPGKSSSTTTITTLTNNTITASKSTTSSLLMGNNQHNITRTSSLGRKEKLIFNDNSIDLDKKINLNYGKIVNNGGIIMNNDNGDNDNDIVDGGNINDNQINQMHNNNNNKDNENGTKLSIVPSTNTLDYQNSKFLPHWTQNITVYQSLPIDDCEIMGGSDYGQMPYFKETGQIIIEIDGQQVPGLTSYDIKQLLSRSVYHNFKVLTDTHSLPLELKEYLSRRFARGSIDHKLQETIRDNIYARTMPVTTRPIRDGEVDGVDYKFITKEQFINMEKNGFLLESGIYCNYYYGTPLPSINITNNAPTVTSNSITSIQNFNNNNDDNLIKEMANNNNTNNNNQSNDELLNDDSAKLNNILAKRKRNRSNLAAIDAASLPYGWERISDAHYGVYYIDHINKRTQYERPYEIELAKGLNGFGFTLIEIDKGLIVVKSLIQGGSAATSGVIQPGDVLVSVAGVSVSGFQHSDIAHLFSTFNVGDRVRLTFARGYQLPLGINDEDYDIINLKIIKGFQGFGFTISEGHNGQKVKKILDLERCCSLRQGDILLSINGIDLTMLSHLEVVEILKQCLIDEPTEFMVKRKKRFRSKTPNIQMESSALMANDGDRLPANNNTGNDVYVRNCKTPNPEMFTQKQTATMPFFNGLPMKNNNNNNNNIYKNFSPPPPPPSSSSTIQQMPGYLIDELNKKDNYDELKKSNYQLHQTLPATTNNQLMNKQHYQMNNYNNFYSNQMDYMNLINNTDKINENNIIGNEKKSLSVPMLVNPMDNGSLGRPRPVNSSSSNQIAIQQQDSLSNQEQSQQNLSFFDNVDIDYEYYQININRTDSGFGFRIIGGSEDGSNIIIGSIVLGGAAHQEGTLKAGDELIAINGKFVVGFSHQDVVQLMSQTGTQVTILVRRKRYLNAYDVTLHRQDYEGFGFVIISCGTCALIGRIIEGSPAHRCNRLHIRDRIIAVNGVDVTNMSHPEIVNKIKESDDILELRIVPADCYTCELIRGNNGYGFSIRGGAEFNNMPLFILCIAANGPASQFLMVGDEILEINEHSTYGMTHQEAVQLINQSGQSVRLRLRHNFGNNAGEFFNNLVQMPGTQAQENSSNSLMLGTNAMTSGKNIATNRSMQIQSPPPPPPPPAAAAAAPSNSSLTHPNNCLTTTTIS